MKIRYRGRLIGGKWIYEKPKTVELPIPYVSKSEKTGEVLCDPIGEFTEEDGNKLLALSGDDGPFVLETTVEDLIEDPPFTVPQATAAQSEVNKVEAEALDRFGRPKRTEHEQHLLQKRINRAQLQRGRRKRAVRSDKGVPRPRQPISADTVVQPQADSEPTPQTAAG